MRDVVLFSSISIDGFMEAPNRDLSWHRIDEEVHQYFNDYLSGMGAFLSGRVTYEMMAEYWPTADSNPESPPAEVEFAGIWREMPKYVFSKTLERADWNTTIMRDVVPDEINALKAQPGGDLLVGGAVLGGEFMRQGLIDQYRLYVHPIAIGQGTP